MSPAQERTLLARLEAARQVGATCLGEARKWLRLVRESKVFQQARTLCRVSSSMLTRWTSYLPMFQYCSQNLLVGIASANLLLKRIPESQELFSITRTGGAREALPYAGVTR